MIVIFILYVSNYEQYTIVNQQHCVLEKNDFQAKQNTFCMWKIFTYL